MTTFNASNEIEATYKSGIIYGTKEIIPTGTGTFYVTAADGSEHDKRYGQPINIDCQVIGAQPIEQFGFTQDDFKCVPLNKYGLKELVKYDNETLVVTANGLFVIYSGSLPSLIGLPSDIQIASGAWVDEEGNVNLPNVTVFSKSQNNLNAILCAMASYRTMPLGVLNQTHWTASLRGCTYNNWTGGYPVNVFREDERNYSRYAEFYPTLSIEAKETYEDIVAEKVSKGKSKTNNMTLESIIVDPTFY